MVTPANFPSTKSRQDLKEDIEKAKNYLKVEDCK